VSWTPLFLPAGRKQGQHLHESNSRTYRKLEANPGTGMPPPCSSRQRQARQAGSSPVGGRTRRCQQDVDVRSDLSSTSHESAGTGRVDHGRPSRPAQDGAAAESQTFIRVEEVRFQSPTGGSRLVHGSAGSVWLC
jgi:hypothetical protein